MKFQVLLSLLILTTAVQGLFLKTALKKKLLVSALLPSLGGGDGSESGSESESESESTDSSTGEETGDSGDRDFEVVERVVYYATPVVYRQVRPVVRRRVVAVRESNPLGDLKSSVGNLVSGSARAFGNIGSTIGGLLPKTPSLTASLRYSSN